MNYPYRDKIKPIGVTMPDWKELLSGDPLPWLLEPDTAQPAIRYFTLRDILGHDDSDSKVKKAQAAIMLSGPVPVILAAQQPDGYWNKPGPGYGPKYQGTIWSVIFLAQLGADGANPQVRSGCEYVLSHSIASNGGFSVNGTPSFFIHCMAGNLGAALIDLGWSGDKRLQVALDWQARYITGDGIADPQNKDSPERYYKSGTTGPLFACAANGGLPCAWGAVKAMLALGKVPLSQRNQRIQSAVQHGIGFLLSRDPAVADYPFGPGSGINSSWFKFGYPLGYVTDVLQNLEALSVLGKAQNPKLTNALKLVLSKQNDEGRWLMKYSYNGKMWIDIEKKGKPSKWVTLRALRVLKAAYPE